MVRGRVHFLGPANLGIRGGGQQSGRQVTIVKRKHAHHSTTFTRTTFQLYHLLPHKRLLSRTWQEITTAKTLRERSHLS